MTDIFKSSVLPDGSDSDKQESTVKRDALSIVIQDAQDMQSSTTIISLSSYINKCWTSAREAKKPIQEALNASALQRRGEYSAEKLSEIKQMSGSTVFMDITSVKCRAAEAWIGDMLSPFNDLIWSISPTPIPTLPPDVKQYIDNGIEQDIENNPMLFKTMDDEREYREYFYDESLQAIKKDAQLRSTRMQNKILDQLTEAGWKSAISESISDIVTYKAGFLKGPFVRRKPATDWVQDMSTGAYKTDVIDKLVVEYERPSPFNMYPSPDSTNIEDGFIIEHHRLSRKDLIELEGVPGYDEDAIHLVLEKFGETGTDSWLWEKREQDEAEGRTQSTVTSNPETIIDALEFWGSCSGKLLLDWGMEESDIEDPDGEYQINAWLIGEYIIKAVLNPHPLKRKPYYKASFEEINGAFWGRGVPELMSSIQDVCNATARALVNNEAICSGPQITVDTSKLEPGQDIEEMFPWKVWYYDSALASWSSTGGEAIKFFNPQSNASELLAVYNQFSLKADEYTGIPAYTYGGSNVGGAGSTATGLSMLMSNASKAIKFVLASVDSNIIEPSINSLYLFNMMYDEDNSIKGDLVVRARGALSMVQKEQMTVRRTEFMNMLANNPMYLDIIGKKGVSILLRDVIKSLEMPWEDIVPSEQEIEANDAEKQFMNQIMQMAMAVQQGQMAPEEFIQQIMSQLPQQQGGQGGQPGGQPGGQGMPQGMPQGGQPMTGKGTPVSQANTSPISPVINRGTPPRARGTMPDGSIAGGRDASLFLQRRQ